MTSKKLIYRTLTGREIEYEPVSPIVLELSEQGAKKEFIERGEPLDPPTYTVELAGGGTQTFPHDLTTLTTDEDKATWAKYLDAKERLETEQARLRKLIILECLKDIILPEDNTWEVKQKARKVDVPQEPDEKLVHYIQTEILKSSADFRCLTDAILRAGYLGAVGEDVIEASSSLFQDRIQAATRAVYDATPKLEKPDSVDEPGGVGA